MVCFWAARDGVRSGPRTAQGTDGHGWVGHADWRPALGSGIVSGGASTRQSPLVHCELCVVCGVWCVVLELGNSATRLVIDVASKFYPKDAEAFDEYLQIDFESLRVDAILDPLPFLFVSFVFDKLISLCRCRRITSKRIRSKS